MRHVLVLLNARAGTLLDRSTDDVVETVEKALTAEGRTIEVRLLRGEELTDAISHAGSGPHDTVIVGGGDGTASFAVQHFVDTKKVLGLLPLGTLNLLARDLGMPLPLAEALAALSKATPQKIDLGSLNGRPFHTVSGVGFFSQMARARETARSLKFGRFFALVIAAIQAMRRSGRFELDLNIDGTEMRVDAFAAVVTVNRFVGPGWHRDRLDEDLLEVHIAEDHGALAKLKAGADMMTNNWRGNPGIRSFTARRLVIEKRTRSRVWVSTDGELARETIPLRYDIAPKALTVLMPERKTATK